MGVDMGALWDVLRGNANGFPIFDHAGSLRDVPESEFMPGGDVFSQKEAAGCFAGGRRGIVLRPDPCAAGQRLKRYGYRILRMDPDAGLFHGIISSYTI